MIAMSSAGVLGIVMAAAVWTALALWQALVGRRQGHGSPEPALVPVRVDQRPPRAPRQDGGTAAPR